MASSSGRGLPTHASLRAERRRDPFCGRRTAVRRRRHVHLLPLRAVLHRERRRCEWPVGRRRIPRRCPVRCLKRCRRRRTNRLVHLSRMARQGESVLMRSHRVVRSKAGRRATVTSASVEPSGRLGGAGVLGVAACCGHCCCGCGDCACACCCMAAMCCMCMCCICICICCWTKGGEGEPIGGGEGEPIAAVRTTIEAQSHSQNSLARL